MLAIFIILRICGFVKALFTWDILAHNIAIKRFCNKNLFLSHGFQWLAKVSSKQTTNQGTLCFVKSLPCLSLKSMAQK